MLSEWIGIQRRKETPRIDRYTGTNDPFWSLLFSLCRGLFAFCSGSDSRVNVDCEFEATVK